MTKVRIEYLDGTVEVVSKAKWDELSKDEHWLEDQVASADIVEAPSKPARRKRKRL